MTEVDRDRQVTNQVTPPTSQRATYGGVAPPDQEATRAIVHEPHVTRDRIADAHGRWKAQTRDILRMFFGEPEARSFAVRYWDGTVERPSGGSQPGLTLVLKHPGALRRMLLPPTELSVAEAYIYDDIDAEGDLERAADLGEAMAKRIRPTGFVRRILPQLLALPTARPDLEAGGGLRVVVGGSAPQAHGGTRCGATEPRYATIMTLGTSSLRSSWMSD